MSASPFVVIHPLLDSMILLDESWDNMSEEDANSSPLFKLGRSPLSVVEVTPILVDDPPEVVFGSFVEEFAVIDALAAVDVALDSVLDEEVVSVPPLALAGVAAVEAEVEAAEEDVEAVIEDDAGADVVADVVFVELACVLVVVIGGDEFVFPGVTT